MPDKLVDIVGIAFALTALFAVWWTAPEIRDGGEPVDYLRQMRRAVLPRKAKGRRNEDEAE